MDVKKLTVTKKETKIKLLQSIIDLFTDLMGLGPIIFDALDVFWVQGSYLVISTKRFGSGRYFGPIYGLIKTLKLQYLLNGMCYEGG